MVVSVHTLSNGIPVVIDHEKNTECVSIGINVNVGARHETTRNNGTAHFLEHMAFKGTKTQNAQQIIAAMEDMGASPNAATGYESTIYYMSGLGGDAPVFAKMLADIVTKSILPAREMEIERGAIIQEIGMYNDDPQSVAFENSTMTAFPGQPLGASILGPVENIRNFKRGVLKGFMDRHYHAGNMLVAVAGNVDAARLVDVLEKELGGLARKNPSLYVPAKYVGGCSHEERPTQQLQIVAEFKAAARKDPDVWDTKMLAAVLGGGMSSRLFTEIREKRGLVYGISAGHQDFADVGTFMIYAGTGEKEAQTLIPVLCDELNKVRTGGVEERELLRVKASAKVGLARAAGSMDARMRSIPGSFQMHGRVPTTAEKLAQIEKITPDSVRDVANRIFSSTLNFATVGPASKVEPYDKIQARLKL
jgi:predicted Zn-dependent peptidase